MKTTIRVRYPRGRGDIGLRGSPPLSWEATAPPTAVEDDVHLFELDAPEGAVVELKVVRGESDFAAGHNHTVVAGETLALEPHFDRTACTLEGPHVLGAPELGRAITFRVVLPPSYGELPHRRYPVVYAQDGQALFGDAAPIDAGGWHLDETLDALWQLGACEEAIVVAVHTDAYRLPMLTPVPDAKHGGGGAGLYLEFLASRLKPAIDASYRTEPARERTALLGSSLGGLFSFFAAWTRPDLFGRAACLSSSFWWADRWMVRHVREGACPLPRPFLYIDSGAAVSPFEEDASVKDGFHDTVALRNALVGHCYEPAKDLVVLAFAGARHDPMAWAARLAMPLQLLVPPTAGFRAYVAPVA